MAILTEVTRHLPVLVTALKSHRLRNLPLASLLAWMADLAEHRIASALLIESGAVEAALRAALRRKASSRMVGLASRMIQSWLGVVIGHMSEREQGEEEIVSEFEQLLASSRLIELVIEFAGMDEACPCELRGHLCTWIWILDTWGEEDPNVLEMFVSKASSYGLALIYNPNPNPNPNPRPLPRLGLSSRHGPRRSSPALTT